MCEVLWNDCGELSNIVCKGLSNIVCKGLSNVCETLSNVCESLSNIVRRREAANKVIDPRLCINQISSTTNPITDSCTTNPIPDSSASTATSHVIELTRID